jgi:hypothetical protein
VKVEKGIDQLSNILVCLGFMEKAVQQQKYWSMIFPASFFCFDSQQCILPIWNCSDATAVFQQFMSLCNVKCSKNMGFLFSLDSMHQHHRGFYEPIILLIMA